MKIRIVPLALLLLTSTVGCAIAQELPRPRARELGLGIGKLPTGRQNAITDVDNVQVGHVTLNEGENVRTGVTVIFPHRGNVFRHKVHAAIVVGNGFGKLVGVTQVEELGTLETPIALTNTLCVWRAAEGLVEHTLTQPGNENVRSVNPVVGETNDSYLNDIRRPALEPKHIAEAYRLASSGPVEEGSVGAGTGTRCFGFKGGIGTSSRRIESGRKVYTVGVLVQSNFGGALTIKGARVGRDLRPESESSPRSEEQKSDGSCMIVVATDAPLDARRLKRVGRRALLGLGATGSAMAHGSGDYVIAFTTARDAEFLADASLTPIFQATRDATEEAILNSLLRARTTTGYQQRKLEEIPVDRLIDLCRKHRVLEEDSKPKPRKD